MHNLRLFFTQLLLLLTTTTYSQKIDNGYYNNINRGYYIYVRNDTIMLPYNSGMIGLSILKGVIKDKKWINFIPIKNKMESSYNIVEKKKNDSVSILRFNLYSYLDTTLFSNLFDGRYGTFSGGYAMGYGLGCELAYITSQNILIKKDTSLVFNGKYFEVHLPSDKFTSANLTVRGGSKYITVPIYKDSLLFVDIIKAPPVFYNDKQKRMRYKYSVKEQSIYIKFNFPFDNTWHKFIRSQKTVENKYKLLIEKHINDM